MEQVHGKDIENISAIKDNCDEEYKYGGVDGMFFINKLEEAVPCIKVADCMPVFIFYNQVLAGVLHAGWRGVAGGIGLEVVKAIAGNNYDRKKVTFFIGPHICKNCFKASKEVLNQFPTAAVNGNKIDLFEAFKIQMLQNGIMPENVRLIKEKDYCTYENKQYCSHRRGDSDRMFAFAIQN